MERTEQELDKELLARINCRILVRNGPTYALVPGSDSCNHSRNQAGKHKIRLDLNWYYSGNIIPLNCNNCPVFLKAKQTS